MDIKTKIKTEDIVNLIVSALEGGSNYWYLIEKRIKPKKFDYLDKTRPSKGGNWYYEYPLNPGGALIISSQEEPEKGNFRLDLKSIKKGLQIMAKKYPNHYKDILADNTDATTGDVLLQLALFGELIYG